MSSDYEIITKESRPNSIFKNIGNESNRSKHIPGMISRLVNSFLDCEGLNPENATIFQQHFSEFALRILDSELSRSRIPDRSFIVESIKRTLNKIDETGGKCIAFSRLYHRLCLKGYRGLDEILVFLFALLGSEIDKKNEASTPLFSKTLGTLFNAKHSIQDNSRLSSCSEDTKQFSNTMFDTFIGREEKMPSPKFTSIHNTAHSSRSFSEYSDYENASYEVPETLLLRDALYVFQGIDGSFIHYDNQSETFLLEKKIGIPKPTRKLLKELADVGLLYKKIQHEIKVVEREPFSLSLMQQSLFSAIREELDQFFRWIASLESQIISNGPLSSDEKLICSGIGLKQLWVSIKDYEERLRWTCVLLESCRELKGGALLNKLHDFLDHGDSMVHSLANRFFERTMRPFFEMVKSWTYHGVIEDRFSEFFIGQRDINESHRMWTEKYFFRDSMRVNFFSEDTCQKIFIAGKSVDFLRNSCGVRFWADISKVENPQTDQENIEKFKKFVDVTYKAVSSRTIEFIVSDIGIFKYLSGLRNYFFLLQGDFSIYLLNAIVLELEKPSITLYRHNLIGILDSAIRCTNPNEEVMDVAKRLDVCLLDPNEIEASWDTFCLDYHADPPLNTILHPLALGCYKRIFGFLWKLKLAEDSLKKMWRKQMSLPKFSTVLLEFHQYSALYQNMLHFLQQFQHYLLYEVFERHWQDFNNSICKSLENLGDFITAHDNYLGLLMEGIFLTEETEAIRIRLTKLISLIIRYSEINKTVFDLIIPAPDKNPKGMGIRSGLYENDQISTSCLADMNQRLNFLAREYFEELNLLLSQIQSKKSERPEFLFLRLNFNEYYRR